MPIFQKEQICKGSQKCIIFNSKHTFYISLISDLLNNYIDLINNSNLFIINSLIDIEQFTNQLNFLIYFLFILV